MYVYVYMFVSESLLISTDLISVDEHHESVTFA